MQATLLAILAVVLGPPALASEKTRIELADRVVEGLIDAPKGAGPRPFLVVAVGDDADLKDRLYANLAAAAVKEGFVTLRLDWSYKKKKGAVASADLKREAEELGIVVNEMIGSRMMKQYDVDPAKVAVVAKGFGAKVAMQPESGAFGEKVKAAILLNPDCGSSAFATVYAPFLAAKMPRMIVAARGADCPLPLIYAAAKDFGEEVALFTLEGDARFRAGKGNANQDAAIGAAANWLRNRGWVAEKKAIPKKPDARRHSHDGHSAGTHP